MMKPMTIRAYAAHRKCSRQAVEKAISSGRIVAIAGKGGRLIDPVAADKAWRENSDPFRGGPMSGYGNPEKPGERVAAEDLHPDTMVRIGDVLDQMAESDAAENASMSDRIQTALESLVDEMVDVSVEPGPGGVRVISADLARALMAPAAAERVEADEDPIRQMMRVWVCGRLLARIDVMVQPPEPGAT